ncbi:hypothetical protein [Methylobacterium sp. JK268]
MTLTRAPLWPSIKASDACIRHSRLVLRQSYAILDHSAAVLNALPHRQAERRLPVDGRTAPPPDAPLRDA